MLTLVIAGLTAVLDQIVKLIVQGNMELGETIPLIRNVFHLTYIINPGAAFGIFPHQEWFFLGIVVVLYAAFFIFRSRIPAKPVYFPAGVGVRIGGVVDFFDFRIWPIFNVADIAICVGVALIVLYFWRKD